MILYRPVGLQELELIYDGGMKTFPARLSQQPIFYPVLQLEYARQVASDWNVKSGQSAGYVTQFKMEDTYIDRFETHTVGGSQYEELWIPAEVMEEFNRHIIGHIKVVEAYFGKGFQGFIPDKSGLQGKDVIAQFTDLANSFVYKRMDFYLEIKRNHKAIFLNYPYWLKHDFKNQGLKEKVLQGIREAWLTSFPKTPLANPAPEENPSVQELDSPPARPPAPKETPAVNKTASTSLVRPTHKDIAPREQTRSHHSENPVPEKPLPVRHPQSDRAANPVREVVINTKQESPITQGIKAGLSGNYPEAIQELSKAVEKNPGHVVAHTSLGVASHRSGDDDRALSCYKAALKIDPNYAEAHYFLANILYSRGDVRGAIAEYTIAIGLKPELIDAHQVSLPEDRLTDFSSSPAEMYRIAKPAHRILDLNRSLAAHPQQASLYKERAAHYYRLLNYEQAIADYSSSLAIQPEDAGALHLRGLAYEQLGQLDRALEDYQQAIHIDPDLSSIYINRGIAFGKMGQFRQSIASLTEAIRLAPDNPDGYFNRGTTYLQQGDFEAAVDDFSNVIRLTPGDESAYYWRGISNEEAGHRREAITDYKQFLAISQNPQAREEIEQKLWQWDVDTQDVVSRQSTAPGKRQETIQAQSEEPDQDLDFYNLMVALGKRALRSTWYGSGVECYGEKAEELYAAIDQDQPVEGRELLQIARGIHAIIKGDLYALDPGADSHWMFIRAWEGNGYYLEVDDPDLKQHLITQMQAVEEVEGAQPPYEGLFIRI